MGVLKPALGYAVGWWCRRGNLGPPVSGAKSWLVVAMRPLSTKSITDRRSGAAIIDIRVDLSSTSMVESLIQCLSGCLPTGLADAIVWRWMYAVSLPLSRSSSVFFPATPPAPPTWKSCAGRTDSPVQSVGLSARRTVFRSARPSCSDAVAAKPMYRSRQAPSCRPATCHCLRGSGARIW